jgi:hypothetical protein
MIDANLKVFVLIVDNQVGKGPPSKEGAAASRSLFTQQTLHGLLYISGEYHRFCII